MKKTIIALTALMVTVSAFGQGAVVFNNRVPPGIDAKVTFGGVGITGAEWKAQLFGGPENGTLSPLTPTTTFRAGNAAGYVNPVDVIVPNVAPGNKATLVMRAFNGADFASSALSGSSDPITITLGGGTLPPANLDGLRAFQIIPEPSTIALGLLGGLALLFWRRK
jgi:hypothetical protein